MSTALMDLKPYVPQLSLKERDRRWRATRECMAEKEIDCLIVWGNTISQGLGMTNVRYLTQVGSWHGGIALFPYEGGSDTVQRSASHECPIQCLPGSPGLDSGHPPLFHEGHSGRH